MSSPHDSWLRYGAGTLHSPPSTDSPTDSLSPTAAQSSPTLSALLKHAVEMLAATGDPRAQIHAIKTVRFI